MKVDDIRRREATKTVVCLVVFLQSVTPASFNLFEEVLKLIKLLPVVLHMQIVLSDHSADCAG